MMTVLFMLLIGGPPRTPILDSIEPQRPVGTILVDDLGRWQERMKDQTPNELQTLWSAHYVLYYSGPITGIPDSIIIGFSAGEFRRGWHRIDLPRLTEPLNQLWLVPPFRANSTRFDGPVVIVLDARDFFPDDDMRESAADKAEELRLEGVQQVIALRRGAPRVALAGEKFTLNEFAPFECDRFDFYNGPPSEQNPLHNTMMICWIAQSELSLVFSSDFTRLLMLDRSQFTLDPHTNRVRGGRPRELETRIRATHFP